MAKAVTVIYRRLQNICFSLNSSPFCLKVFRCIKVGMKYFMKLIGPVFVILCTTFVSFIIWTYFSIVYPLLCRSFAYFNVVIAIAVGYNILYNYVMCVLTDPGSPPTCLDPSSFLGGVTGGDIEGGSKGHGTRYMLDVAPAIMYKYCIFCKAIKPPRTHHCNISDKCVLNMDHFCPWMNNAVGYYNFRYFYLFLLYIFFGAFYASVVFAVCYKTDAYELRSTKLYWMRRYIGSSMSNEQVLMYAIALCIAAVISVGGLLAWHTYLLVTNQTTIEYYVNFEEAERCKELQLPFKNPFDRGWKTNIMRLASSAEVATYSVSHWPSWLNWLNWLGISTYKMIGPSKYSPPEPEYAFIIDDSNRDQLFRTAIEYNQKLLAASKRRYDNSSFNNNSDKSIIKTTTGIVASSVEIERSAPPYSYSYNDGVTSDCVSATRGDNEIGNINRNFSGTT